jgi:hypothetical protein
MDNIEDVTHPVSPSGQYFNTPILCSYVFGFLESEIPIDDSQTMYLFKHVFLPINPRFSSIMVHLYIYVVHVYFLFTNFSYDININLYIIYLYVGERQRWENEMEKSRSGS